MNTDTSTKPLGARIREALFIIASDADQGVVYPDDIAGLRDMITGLLARPIVDQTVNAGYVVRAVIDGSPGNGLLKSWWVACESTDEPGTWVTWEAYALDGSQAGKLGYNAGHYFQSPTRACRDGLNRQRALADLAVRAGTMSQVAVMIADEITRYHAITGPYTSGEREDRRMASRLRKWAA